MALTSDIISQFVKATNDTKETKKESTVYGTIVTYEDTKYVKLDGSDLLTPISSTTVSEDGDRVLVTIKNHSATVTGNVTSPSASDKDVQKIGTKISEFEIVIADKVSTKDFDAEKGRIDDLTADNVLIKEKLTASEGYIKELKAKDVEIEGKLTARDAEIENLKSTKIDASIVTSQYATIENLKATNTKVNNLEATYGEFKDLTTDKFNAIDADIKNLDSEKIDVSVVEANYAKTKDLEATYAKITDLNATNANVKNLDADVGKIDTLIFGSASGDTIQTSFANAVIAQLGNAQIKSAMIESLSTDKLLAGDIYTNNIRVMSEDGKLLISDETIQISDDDRVRVQIGKDAAGDYSINIWDADGKLMFSEGGITDSAIKEAIIRNDMVSENANIAASKLDISSLFKEINDSKETINAGRILMDADGQTLDVTFTKMTTDMNNLSESAKKAQEAADVAQKAADDAADVLSKAEENLDAVTSRVDATEEEIAAAQKAVEEAQTAADQAQADANTAKQVADAAKAAADANAEDISELNTKVTTQGTTLSVVQGQINSKVWQQDIETAVNDIEVGGRNIVRGTGTGKGWNYSTFDPDTREFTRSNTSTHENFIQCIDTDSFDLEAGQTYTLSFHAKQNGYIKKDTFDVYVLPATFSTTGIAYQNFGIPIGTEYELYSLTFVPASYATDLTNCSIRFDNNGSETEGVEAILYVKDVKLEKGNVATDWTPAPEDVEADISTLNTQYSELDQTVDSISATVADHTTEIAKKADGSTVTEVSDKVSDLELSLEGFKTSVSETYVTQDDLSAAETSIEENAKQIALRAKITDVNKTLENYYTIEDADAAIELSADGIKQHVSESYTTKAEFDNLEIGGRNLLLNTSKSSTDAVKVSGASIGTSGLTWLNSGGILTLNCNVSTTECYYRFMSPETASTYGLEPGCDYTISGKMKVSTTSGTLERVAVRSQHYISSSWTGGINNAVLTADSDECVDFEFTHSIPETAKAVYFSVQVYFTTSWSGVVQCKDLKLEKGNRATDWTPAPEDLETRMYNAETAINQTAQDITLLATKTEVNEVKSDLGNYYTKSETESKISAGVGSINLSVYATKTDLNTTNSNVTKAQNAADAAQADIDGLNVGGRNLIAGTDEDTEYVGNIGTGTYKDVWAAKTIVPPEGTEYVVSFDAKADVAQDIACFFYSPNTTTKAVSSTGQTSTSQDGHCRVNLTTEWARYWVKWTQTPADTVKNVIVGRNSTANDIYIRAVKFESGNKATDWTPAPEDVQTSLDENADAAYNAQHTADEAKSTAGEAMSEIELINNAISMLITDENGASQMVQTSTGWTFNISNIESTVASAMTSISALNNSDAALQSAVGSLQSGLSGIQPLTAWIRVTENQNGKPCVELGETDSDFRIEITNTELTFYNGTNRMAWMSNEEVHIVKAVVENEIQIGKFVIKERASGNVGFQWKG